METPGSLPESPPIDKTETSVEEYRFFPGKFSGTCDIPAKALKALTK